MSLGITSSRCSPARRRPRLRRALLLMQVGSTHLGWLLLLVLPVLWMARGEWQRPRRDWLVLPGRELRWDLRRGSSSSTLDLRDHQHQYQYQYQDQRVGTRESEPSVHPYSRGERDIPNRPSRASRPLSISLPSHLEVSISSSLCVASTHRVVSWCCRSTPAPAPAHSYVRVYTDSSSNPIRSSTQFI